MFAPRGSHDAVESGTQFSPKFDADGLIACIATDAETGQVVMFAHMNAEALALTIETSIAHYWSRSRGKLWRKGETSGHEQKVASLRVDCDQDALWLVVRTGGTGANCHTGRKGCFYREVPIGRAPDPEMKLSFVDDELLFDPSRVYGG
nr:phosphoribosyl-AMP cyclohydrolase [Agaricicola taiwanensis]